MKYYAVTDDPNELLHYGRLGMKWGQHIFVGPKSLSYKKAENKLRGKIQQAKQAHQVRKAAREIRRQQKQQDKFNKAVQKSQQRIALSEGFSNIDRITSYEKADRQAFKMSRKMDKIADRQAKVNAKNELRFAKNDVKMDKYLQLARQNKLKYGQLSTDQVQSINSRLALEANTRRLGGAEESYKHRMKEAFKEGTLQGISQGTAAGMREVAIAKVQNRLKNKAALDRNNRQEAERQKEATRIKNHKTRHEIRQDARQEARETKFETDSRFARRNMKHRIKGENDALQYKLGNEAGKENLKLKNQYDVMQKLYTAQAYNGDDGKKLKKLEAENEVYDKLAKARAYTSDTGSELRRRENQQDYERTLNKLENEGRLAYEYGIGLGSGNNQGQGKKNKNGGGQQYSTDDALKYYRQKLANEESNRRSAQQQEDTQLREQMQRLIQKDKEREEKREARKEHAVNKLNSISDRLDRSTENRRKRQERDAMLREQEKRIAEMNDERNKQEAAQKQAQKEAQKRARREANIDIWGNPIGRVEQSNNTRIDSSDQAARQKEQSKKYAEAAKAQREARSTMNQNAAYNVNKFDQAFQDYAENVFKPRRRRRG